MKSWLWLQEPEVSFQVFDDTAPAANWQNVATAKLKQCRKWIEQKTAEGCGIIFTLNKTDGNGRRSHNVLEAFTHACDFDNTACQPPGRSSPKL